jgi:serine/threonine-protein kinase RIO1
MPAPERPPASELAETSDVHLGHLAAGDGRVLAITERRVADRLYLLAQPRLRWFAVADRLTARLSREADLELQLRAYRAGLNVPYPLDTVEARTLDAHERPLPTLADAAVPLADRKALAASLIDQLTMLWQLEVVLASAHPGTVLVWRDRVWLVDWHHAVDARRHPLARQLFTGDIGRISAWSGEAIDLPPSALQARR